MQSITDLTLLALLVNRQYYSDYREYLVTETLEPEIQKFAQYIDYYAKAVPAEESSMPDFTAWFMHSGPYEKCNDSQKELYRHFLENMSDVNLEGHSAQEILKHYQELSTTTKLYEVLESDFNYDKIASIVDKHEQKIASLGNDDDGWIPNDLDQILNSTNRAGGLQFRLGCLSKSLNCLIKGDFGIVAAYVDTGKTTLAISEAAHMAQQITDGCVLFLNNEEFDCRVMEKIWQAVLGQPKELIKENKQAAAAAYRKKMNGDMERIKFINIRGKSIGQIKTLFKRYNPKLAIIDQIDKIVSKSSKDGKEHERLKSLYGEVRSLANDYCPIIAISQADASTRWMNRETEEIQYQKYIDQSQLDGSKVGKPGEADFIITIGKDNCYPNIRYIHVAKNKMDGVDERYRSIKAEVKFNGKISRYENP